MRRKPFRWFATHGGNSRCFVKRKVKWLPHLLSVPENSLNPTGTKLTPSYLRAESAFLNTNVGFTDIKKAVLLPSFSRTMPLPLSAVFVAQLAHFHGVGVLPHQRVVLPQHALGTSRHAEQSILEVGTLCTVCRALDGCKERLVMFTTLLRRGGVYVNCHCLIVITPQRTSLEGKCLEITSS